jgi:hypothetical protein
LINSELFYIFFLLRLDGDFCVIIVSKNRKE